MEEIQKKNFIDEKNDHSLYKTLAKKYQNVFEELLNNELNLHKVDNIIESSNLYFSPSQTTLKYIPSKINSKYLRCLNTFYVEKLSEEDIAILKESETEDNLIKLVKKTYKEVLLKPGVKRITYNPPTPDRIVENGSVVFELSYGKNIIELSNEKYIENLRKQQKVLKELTENIEHQVKVKMNVPCKVIVEKRI